MLKSFFTLTLLMTSVSTFALTNSTPAVAPNLNYVMQIMSDAPDSKGDTTPGYCNATLIHKNVMVTAAHCVFLAYISGEKKIQMDLGEYKYIVRKTDGQTVRIGYVLKSRVNKDTHIELPKSLVDKIARRGEKATIGPDDDVALIWWNDDIPEFANVVPADVVTPTEHANIIKNITQTALNAVTINPFSEMSTDTKRMATLNNYKWSGYVHSKSQSRVEEGDSGSPLFATVNGKSKIFAVVKGKASTVFDNWDVYAAVNPHICQMASTLPSFIKISSCN